MPERAVCTVEYNRAAAAAPQIKRLGSGADSLLEDGLVPIHNNPLQGLEFECNSCHQKLWLDYRGRTSPEVEFQAKQDGWTIHQADVCFCGKCGSGGDGHTPHRPAQGFGAGDERLYA